MSTKQCDILLACVQTQVYMLTTANNRHDNVADTPPAAVVAT